MTDRIAFAGKVEAVEGRTIRGSVQLAGSRTRRNGEWLEVDPAALVKANASNVLGRFNHDPDKVMGRASNGTVRISRTDQGIDYEIDVNETSFGNDALVMARRGDFGGSSFEIGRHRSRFYADPETGERVRVLTSIEELTDVSPVIDPAFANSSVAAFGKESDMPEPEVIAAPPAAPPAAPESSPEPRAAFSQTQPDGFVESEAFARRQSTEALEQAMDALIAAGDLKGARLAQYMAFAKVFDERAEASAEAAQRAENIKLAHQMRTGNFPKAPVQTEVFASDDYKHAFDRYIRSGNPQLMEQFAQTVTGDGTQGGFAVPDGFLNRIVERLKAYGGVARVAEEITTTTGESLRWPFNDDTGNSAAIATEATKVASGGADKVLDSIELGAFEYDATGTGNNPLELSLPLIQDAAFDVVAWVERNLATRIGRKQAVDFANGAGGTEPVGLFTKTPDAMSATAVSLAIPEHILQVDAAYRNLGNCRWLLSDTTLLKIWQSQTTTGVPLIIAGGTIAGRPEDTLWGYPMTNDPAAGTKVAFGDFSLGYIIRRVRDISILVDPYSTSAKRTVAYHAWARADANIQDPFAYSVSEWSTVSADT